MVGIGMDKVKRLNIGSGNDYRNGWVNLDYNKDYNVDIVYNLDKFPYPFKDEEFNLIYCSHILEHVKDFFKTMEELLRILKPDGVLHIKVPHFSNGLGFTDLTHKRFFGWDTFKHLTNGYYNKDFDFKIVEQKFNFLSSDHIFLNRCFNWFFNMWNKKFYERFLCWKIPVGEIELKIKKATDERKLNKWW